MLNELYNQLRNAGFATEIKNNQVIVSLTNRSVHTDEVKFVTDYDERFSYKRDGDCVVVKIEFA